MRESTRLRERNGRKGGGVCNFVVARAALNFHILNGWLCMGSSATHSTKFTQAVLLLQLNANPCSYDAENNIIV